MLRVVLGALQAVRETGKCHADDNRVLALGNDGSVVNFHVFGVVIGEDDTGHRGKRHEDVIVFCRVLIINVDRHLAALTGQVFRRDFLPLVVIGDLLQYRRLLVCRSLIIDIIAGRVPCQHLTVLCKGFVAFHIFDILQCGVIKEFFRAALVFEPVGNGHALLFAARVRKYIYCLFLFRVPGLFAVIAAFHCCGERGRQILFRNCLHSLGVCVYASVHGSRGCRQSRHGHICCHRHCHEQGKNLFSLHDPLSP